MHQYRDILLSFSKVALVTFLFLTVSSSDIHAANVTVTVCASGCTYSASTLPDNWARIGDQQNNNNITIEVGHGEYPFFFHNVQADTNTYTIVGKGMSQTILNGYIIINGSITTSLRELTIINLNGTGISVQNQSKALLNKLRIKDSKQYGIFSNENTSIEVIDSIIENSGNSGINWESSGTVKIIRSILNNNTNYGLRLQKTGAQTGSYIIHNNIFSNTRSGTYSSSTSIHVTDNTLRTGQFSIKNNIFLDSSTIKFAETHAAISNNIFYKNSGIFPNNYGLELFSLSLTDLYDVNHNMYFGYQSNKECIQRIGQNPATCSNNQIVSNPLFQNPDAFDFRLKPGSPAIGAGVNPDGSATDIGIYGGPDAKLPNAPIGNFERIYCNTMIAKGWTCDKDDADRAVTIHAYMDSTPGNTQPGLYWTDGSIKASNPHEDAVGELCGGGSNHGFEWKIPENFNDGKPHTLNLYAIDDEGFDNPLITNNATSKTLSFTCPAPEPPSYLAAVGSDQDLQPSAPSETLYYPNIYLGFSKKQADRTQWPNISIFNPSNKTTTISIINPVVGHEGIEQVPISESYSITLGPYQTYNSADDVERWNTLTAKARTNDNLQASLVVESPDAPVAGTLTWELRKGNTISGELLKTQTIPLIAELSKKLYYPLVLRNWTSSSGYRQWTDLVIYNPSSSATANVTLDISHTQGAQNGKLAKQIQLTINPNEVFDTQSHQEWQNLSNNAAGNFFGTVSITSSQEIIGVNKFRYLSGDEPQNPSYQVIDTPLISVATGNLSYPLVLRNWPHVSGNKTQWTDIFLYNPTQTAAKARIRIYPNERREGENIKEIPIEIPAHGYYSSYGKSFWDELPDMYSAEGKQINAHIAISLINNAKLVGVSRLRIIDGDTYNGKIVYVSDNKLVDSRQTDLIFPSVQRNVPIGNGSFARYSDLMITARQTHEDRNILVNAYRTSDLVDKKNGDIVSIFADTIPELTFRNTYGLGQWHALPKTDQSNTSTSVSIMVTGHHAYPLSAIHRARITDKTPPNYCEKKPIGDADCNDQINLADLQTWREEIVDPSSGTTSDFNSDGILQLADLEIWRDTSSN